MTNPRPVPKLPEVQQSADTAERERKDQADFETATSQRGSSSKANKSADLASLRDVDVKRMNKQQRGTLVDAVLQVDIAYTYNVMFPCHSQGAKYQDRQRSYIFIQSARLQRCATEDNKVTLTQHAMRQCTLSWCTSTYANSAALQNTWRRFLAKVCMLAEQRCRHRTISDRCQGSHGQVSQRALNP